NTENSSYSVLVNGKDWRGRSIFSSWYNQTQRPFKLNEEKDNDYALNNEDLKESKEDELQKELDWIEKYSEYIEKGTYPEDEFNSEDEFMEDVRRTENQIEYLKGKMNESYGKVQIDDIDTGIGTVKTTYKVVGNDDEIEFVSFLIHDKTY